MSNKTKSKPVRKSDKFSGRVFQGITGSAGQPHALAEALRDYGISAKSTRVGVSKFDYPTDHFLDCGTQDFKKIGRYMAKIADDFDIFHFHMRPALYQHPSKFNFPTFMDLVMLKAMGKGICFHFRGSEVRRADLFAEKNPYHYVEGDGSQLIRKFPVESQIFYMKVIESLVDRIFVNDHELQTYVPNSIIVPRLFERSADSKITPTKNDIPLIVHAPSRKAVKGTEFVLSAISRLKKEGHKFDFKLVEGLPHNEAVAIYAASDIIVDQLRIGWYGVLAVEGMSLGKAVVAYIRKDLEGSFGRAKPPVASATPDTIYEVLKELIIDPKLRASYGRSGMRWYKKTHTREAILPSLISHYKEVYENPRPIDPVVFQQLLEFQVQSFKGEFSRFRQSTTLPAPDTNINKFFYVAKNEGFKSAIDSTIQYLNRVL